MADTVRVRYAPSPTGEPHLGNIRTAMFNWLFARRHGGDFIVRIEDTDRERYVERAVPAILEALEWLELDWDEGPVGNGDGSRGPFAPYVQSQRLQHYREMADALLAKGAAYHCYCSPERLDQVRREKQRQKLPPGYDGRCRDLPAEERRRLDGLGTRRVVRFRVPHEGTTQVDDLVRGVVTWENRLLDDFVILKSDGFPTYHLGVVTDDHLMEITHVLRAEEWLPSTPKHLMLYKALGWAPPLFGHLPMILGPDRAKLSKRHGADSALAYRDQGFLAEAAVNFLALLGWSLDGQREVATREEIVSHFSIERVNRAPAVFNVEKLTWMNGVYIRSMAPEELAERLLRSWSAPPTRAASPTTSPVRSTAPTWRASSPWCRSASSGWTTGRSLSASSSRRRRRTSRRSYSRRGWTPRARSARCGPPRRGWRRWTRGRRTRWRACCGRWRWSWA